MSDYSTIPAPDTERVSDPGVAVSPVFIVCGCGATITRAEWSALASLGTMPSEFESHDLLLKNCNHCHSTLSEFVTKETHAPGALSGKEKRALLVAAVERTEKTLNRLNHSDGACPACAELEICAADCWLFDMLADLRSVMEKTR